MNTTYWSKSILKAPVCSITFPHNQRVDIYMYRLETMVEMTDAAAKHDDDDNNVQQRRRRRGQKASVVPNVETATNDDDGGRHSPERHRV